MHFDVTHTLAALRGADVLVLLLDASPAALDATAASVAAAERTVNLAVGPNASSHIAASEALAPTATAAKAATTPGDGLVDAEGELFLACLKATGVPTVVGIVSGLAAHKSLARAAEARKAVTRLFATEFGEGVVRVVEAPPSDATPASTASAGAQLCRMLASVSLREVQWRANRSLLTAQALDWTPDASSDGETGTLAVYGYLKGRPLNVHQLMCLPWGGVYQIIDATAAVDAFARPLRSGAGARVDAARARADAARAAAGTVAADATTAVNSADFTAFGVDSSEYSPLSDTLCARPATAARIRRVETSDCLPRGVDAAMEEDGGVASSAAGSSALAVSVPELRESLQSVAPPEGDGEDEQDLAGMDEEADAAAGGASQPESSASAGIGKRERRPAGVSRYQAAWLVSDDEDDEDEAESVSGEKPAAAAARDVDGHATGAAELMDDGDDADGGGNGDGDVDDDDNEEEEDVYAEGALDPHDPEALRRIRERRAAQQAQAAQGRQAAQERRRRRKVDSAASVLPDGYVPSASLDDAVIADSSGATAGPVAGSGTGSPAVDADASAAEEWLVRQRARAADCVLFPDEVDVPVAEPARIRFQRYRGLKSFRASPWDAKESLPADYARVFGLASFQRAQARIVGEAALAARALESLERGAADSARAARREEVAASATGGGGSVAASASLAPPSTAGATDALQEALGAGWLAPGVFLCLRLAGVPRSALADACASGGGGAPLTLVSLLRHENKASVVHFSLQRTDTYAEPLAAKEPLELHIGLHRLVDVRPQFTAGGAGAISSAGGGRGLAEPFLLGGRLATATAYAPITYAPCPVLAFKRVPLDAGAGSGGAITAAALARAARADGAAGLYPAPDRLDVARACSGAFRLVLVATGAVVGADPDRLVLKRSILTGYPKRVKLRSATVKFMFFNPEDVEYWKPVELYTKHGRAGTIVEPLGTHGLMKCRFDRPITQQDTVCMPLYKRVYPRWGSCYSAALAARPHVIAENEESRGGEDLGDL